MERGSGLRAEARWQVLGRQPPENVRPAPPAAAAGDGDAARGRGDGWQQRQVAGGSEGPGGVAQVRVTA